MIWEAPKLWDKETVYILGGGISLKKIDLSLLIDRKCIGINNAYLLGDWVDVCYFGDSRWLDWHENLDKFKQSWRKYKGLKISCSFKTRDKPDIKYLELSKKQMGIETNLKRVCWNKTSGGSAVNLAYHLGASKIVLLGFDMRNVGNWHDDHFIKSEATDMTFDRFNRCWRFISEDLNKLNVDIVDTCMDGAIPPCIRKEEYLSIIRGSNND